MDPRDEEVIVNAVRRGWAKVPGFLKLAFPLPSLIMRVPKEALDYTVREVLVVLLRACKEGRI